MSEKKRPLETEAEADLVEDPMEDAAPGVRFVHTPCEDPHDMVRRQFGVVLSTRSVIPTQEIFDKYVLAAKSLNNRTEATQCDLHFSEVVYSRCEGEVRRTRKDDEFEFWDRKSCTWYVGKAETLFSMVQRELTAIWAPRRRQRPGQMPQEVPRAFSDGTFPPRIIRNLTRKLPLDLDEPLDDKCRF